MVTTKKRRKAALFPYFFGCKKTERCRFRQTLKKLFLIGVTEMRNYRFKLGGFSRSAELQSLMRELDIQDI
jgi:hypothetical protein